MSNQDIEGKAPAGEAPRAPAGTPASLEQELAKERDARALMRDRLRHTEALAAESHALRSRMAEELERVTADRDRLRVAAAAGASAAGTPAVGGTPSGLGSDPPLESTVPLHAPAAAPAFTPRDTDWPLKPPVPPRRSGPWRALAMLAVLAVVVGAAAWYTDLLPTRSLLALDSPSEATGSAASAALPSPAPRVAPPTAESVLAAASTPAAPPSGAVALPPLTPEAQLAAAPTAAGLASAAPTAAASSPAPVDVAQAVAAAAPGIPAAPAGMAARLRKALDGEGIGAPVDIDSASGHVMVADPQSDDALRDRTDMLIRAVYAGANLPEPQIEHRWMSPRRAGQSTPPAQTLPAAVPRSAAVAPQAVLTRPAPSQGPAQADASRRAGQDRSVDPRGRSAAGATVAEAEELRPVLPEGRVTANCRASLAGKSPHRADLTACMKRSCCSTGSGQPDECRAYQKAYPFSCTAG